MSYRVEQAIFTSLRGDRLAGYQLASRSGGIDDHLAQQLSNWGPAHDALEASLSRASVNVHSLGDGLTCLSYTQLAGSEYSGRGGGRVYTHSFILQTAALALFDFNPFSLLRAFRGAGRTQPRREPPQALEAFALVGRATGAVSSGTSQSPGPLDESQREKVRWTLLAGKPVYLAADEPVDGVMEAILLTLPVENRSGISLSTALKLSPRRPFLFQGVANDPVVIRQLQRNDDAVVIPLCGAATASACK